MFSADSCFLAPPIRILPSFVQKIIFTKIINHKDLLYRFHAIFKVIERFIDNVFQSGSRVSKLLCPDLDPILESPNTVLKLAMSPLACYCSYSCVYFIGQDIELLLLIMKYKVYIKAIIAYWPHRTSPLPPQLQADNYNQS